MKLLNEHHELVKFVVFWLVLPIMAMLWAWFLMHAYPRFGDFTWNLFCDANGKPGIGRVCAFLALHMCFLWDTHIVWKTEKLPDPLSVFSQLMLISGVFAIESLKEKMPELLAAWKGVQLPASKAEEVKQNG